MDNADLEKTFGVDFCRSFSHEFVRNHIRLNVNREHISQEVMHFVVKHQISPDLWLSQIFWNDLIDQLDSKYTIERLAVKSSLTWLSIAQQFFHDIFSNASSHNLNASQISKLQNGLKIILSKKRLNSIDDLFTFIEQTDNFETVPIPASNSSKRNTSQSKDNVATIEQASQRETSVDNRPESPRLLFNEHTSILNCTDASPKADIDKINETIDSQATIITADSEDEVSNKDDSANEHSIDIIENLDINNILDMNENLIDCQEPSKKKAKFDNIPDSLEVGKSKYFKSNHLASDTGLNDSQQQAINDLRLILRPNTTREKVNPLKGKRIQLRTANVDKQPDLTDLSDMEDIVNNCSSDDDSSDSDLSLASRTSRHRLTSNKAKNSYAMEEDYKILKFIIDNGKYAEIKGNHLWKDMEERNLLPDRSWQSMKERFKKTISPSLGLYAEMYKIDKKSIDLLQDNIYYAPASTKNMPKSDSQISVFSSSYSREEDEEIVRFISKQIDSNESPMGRLIWEKTQQYFSRQLNRQRTWQSLKERFVKRIVPRMDKYENIAKLISYHNAVVVIDKCCSSLNTRNTLKQKLKARYNKN